MDLSFIPSGENDRAFFIHVHHAAYREVVEQQFGWDQDLQDKKAGQSFDNAHGHVIYKNGEKIGFLGYIERSDHIWIEDIILLPSQQRQGVGQIVLSMLKDKAHTTNKPLRLQVLKANKAKSLYDRTGFRVYDTTDTHYLMEMS